jgi:hypothetical protein
LFYRHNLFDRKLVSKVLSGQPQKRPHRFERLALAGRVHRHPALTMKPGMARGGQDGGVWFLPTAVKAGAGVIRRERVLTTPERNNASEGPPRGFGAGGSMTKFSDSRLRGILGNPPPRIS